MTYTWTFQPRPYSDAEAKEILAPILSAQTTDWHYNKHHKGYVDALNKIETALETADKSTANGNFSPYGELKRRLPWNHAGTVLHDVYWQVMGGSGDHSQAPTLLKVIEQNFGSYEKWLEDFTATALSTKLSGWVVLTLDVLYSGRLLNVLVDEHQNGAMWGGIPLISLDMFEHAYYHKDGPDRGLYIKNFLAHLAWDRIEKRYLTLAK